MYVPLVQHVHLLYFTPSLRASGEAQHGVNVRETQCEVSGEMGEELKKNQKPAARTKLLIFTQI